VFVFLCVFLPLYAICPLELGAGPTVWYFLLFILLLTTYQSLLLHYESTFYTTNQHFIVDDLPIITFTLRINIDYKALVNFLRANVI
jgi:hypothetical protein